MSDGFRPKVAIVDYEMGNLFSVKQACMHVGIQPMISNRAKDIASADAVILPGVGAFGDAMQALEQLDLVSVLKEIANSSKILLGICLGMQLLMSESYEFGHHKGLGIMKGRVIRFDKPLDDSGIKLKVPQVGWNSIFNSNPDNNFWEGTLLENLGEKEYLYYNHSFYVKPDDLSFVLSTSKYGDTEFCSSLIDRKNNNFGCQFHPERSGITGLKIYKNLASLIKKNTGG